MRKTLDVVIADENRDQGKVFFITEMPASQSEKWAFRAIAALAKSGVELPDDVQTMGMAAIAAMGFQALAGINFADAEPLLDEMMACVEIVPEPSKAQVRRPLIETDAEEVLTRLRLRRAVFELHTGFFTKGAP